jgi:hypothetical protein
MKAAVFLAILAYFSSFYRVTSTPDNLGEVKSVAVQEQHINMASILEGLENLAGAHQMRLIAFNPLFERGSKVFVLRLESSFPNFMAWYPDALQKMPKLKWQHLRLKPKAQKLLVVLEGTYDN